MKTVENNELIRRAFFVEGLSIKAIDRRLIVDRKTIRKAIVEPAPKPYRLNQPRLAPLLGPYQEPINEMLDESDKPPRKQRYTVRTIYQIIREEGYQGCEGGVHNYVCRRSGRSSALPYPPHEFLILIFLACGILFFVNLIY